MLKQFKKILLATTLLTLVGTANAITGGYFPHYHSHTEHLSNAVPPVYPPYWWWL